MVMNKYCYEIKDGKCKGYFKIYQAKMVLFN